MHFNTNRLLPLVLSILTVITLFFLQGNKGFNLWDEGFLWYGAQRVLVGEVPIRDFMSYDPGRYYWSAALLTVLGDTGIMSLRLAVAIFQTCGLVVALILIARCYASRNSGYVAFLTLAAITLSVWMFPRHKLFDISLSIFLVGALASLVHSPTRRRFFLVGFCVGLVAVFGRNHGVYGAVASTGLIVWLSIRRNSGPAFTKGFLCWAGGVAIGFSPVILMAAFVPGFAAAFWESIRFLFEYKSTNLPLPIPWPWTVALSGTTTGDALRNLLISFFFLGTVIFGGGTLFWIFKQRLAEKPVPNVLVATSFLALPYAHFAYSRADIGHLAQGIFPLLIGCLVILARRTGWERWAPAVALCGASIWVMHVFHPGWQCRSDLCRPVEISGSALLVEQGTANDISLLRQLASEYASESRQFVVAPFWPGAYALLERRSPMWAIYALFPRGRTFEEKEIKRIEAAKPGFVLVFDLALDGRDDLRFKNTHPLVHQYITDYYEALPGSPAPHYHLYKPKDLHKLQ